MVQYLLLKIIKYSSEKLLDIRILTIDDLYRWREQINGHFLPEMQQIKRIRFRAVMSYYPASKTTIIVLCNTEMGDIESFESEIAKQIFNK